MMPVPKAQDCIGSVLIFNMNMDECQWLWIFDCVHGKKEDICYLAAVKGKSAPRWI